MFSDHPQKPVPRVAGPDWSSRVFAAKEAAEVEREDACRLRQESRQLRSETAIATRWNSYRNTHRLEDRVSSVVQWRRTLEIMMKLVRDEMDLLRGMKDELERELNQTDLPLSIADHSLSICDQRDHSELVNDVAEKQLKKEVALVECHKEFLQARCEEAWEQHKRLQEVLYSLQVDVETKREAEGIDSAQVKLSEMDRNISLKQDPLEITTRLVPVGTWEENSSLKKQQTDEELANSRRLREDMFNVLHKARNEWRTQNSATEYALRRRLYEIKRLRNELEWQKRNLILEMGKMMKEMKLLEEAVMSKSSPLKVAETRLENRKRRREKELCHDAPLDGLVEEVQQLRQGVDDLRKKLMDAKVTYNGLEKRLLQIDKDLRKKNHSLSTVQRCLDVRTGIQIGEAPLLALDDDVDIEKRLMYL